jgi:hypothetical protein
VKGFTTYKNQFRYEPVVHPRRSFDDELADLEIAQCAHARAALNGGDSGDGALIRYCECAELIISGERVSCPSFHDCSYVAARSRLVPIAEAQTNCRVDKTNGPRWTKVFSEVMEAISAPLVRGSNNGTSSVADHA